MTSIFGYLAIPFLSGFIGYVTNALALTMLFHPYEPKYLFGKKLPFTPGIIPKEKHRIAKAIAGAISENLMNREVLEKNLLSDEMIGKIKTSMDGFFETQRNNQETLREFLMHYLSADEVELMIANLKVNMVAQFSKKLSESDLGSQIANLVVKHALNKLKSEGLSIDAPLLLKPFLKLDLWGKLAELFEEPARKYLTKNINEMVVSQGPTMIRQWVDKEIEDVSTLSMRTLLQGKEEQTEQVTEMVISTYRTIIANHLPRILEAINIPAIIEARINQMDMAETEKLIYQVMDKELTAIVMLGALLGMLMGSINCFLL